MSGKVARKGTLMGNHGCENSELERYVADIEVPSLTVPDLDAHFVSSADKSQKDLFAEKKHAAWKDVQVDEARCDFSPNRMRITNRGGVFVVAHNIAPLIRSVIGSFLSPEDYAIVTTPKRRHKERNFATMIAEKLGKHLGLPFYDDCALAPNRHRVGTVFTANNIPLQRNIIVFDDFVTTGQTLVSMQNLLISHEKNCIFIAGINNKL